MYLALNIPRNTDEGGFTVQTKSGQKFTGNLILKTDSDKGITSIVKYWLLGASLANGSGVRVYIKNSAGIEWSLKQK